jgi:pyruvate dehydrogenase E1 component alpha subunit
MAPNSHRSELGELADPHVQQYRLPCVVQAFEAQRLLDFLRMMLLIRLTEEQIAAWVEENIARCPCHLGIGQEAIAVGVSASLRNSDRIFGTHRSHAHFLAAGGGVYELLAEVLGRADGCSHGMGGSMHLFGKAFGFLGSVPIVAATIPIAVGAALAAKMDRGDDIAVAYFGDGACEEGVLHESLNLAAAYHLPVLFVCENNLYSSHLDIALRQPSNRLSRYADAHHIRALAVDGNDVTATALAARDLVDYARRESEPVFLEAVTYRWRGHVGPKEDIDVGVRRSPELLQAWKQRDPIRRLEEALLSAGMADAAGVEKLHVSVLNEVRAAAQRALAAPFPQPSDLLGFVYAD